MWPCSRQGPVVTESSEYEVLSLPTRTDRRQRLVDWQYSTRLAVNMPKKNGFSALQIDFSLVSTCPGGHAGCCGCCYGFPLCRCPHHVPIWKVFPPSFLAVGNTASAQPYSVTIPIQPFGVTHVTKVRHNGSVCTGPPNQTLHLVSSSRRHCA